MQPDYQKIMAERQQQEQQRYQQTRDPFEYGRQVAQRRYSEIMSGLDSQRASMNQSYGDMYQQARQMAVGRQAAGGPTLSGGMGQQQRDFVSTAEMQQLGQIGQAREQASRDLYSQAQSAMSNAELEGQQATQMELQNQQAQLGLVQQTQQIIQDTNLTDDQKREQLTALGVDYDEVSKNLNSENRGLLGWKGLTDGEITGGDVANAVIRTALAAGAIYFFGPLALNLAKGIGAKFIAGKSGKIALGAKGWGQVASWFKTPGAVSTISQTVVQAAPRFSVPVAGSIPMM